MLQPHRGGQPGCRSHFARGFTLVEMLVSTVILAIGLLALSQLYVAGVLTYHKAHAMSVATQRAQLELERVQNLTFNQLVTALDQGVLVPGIYDPDQGYTLLDSGKAVHFPMSTLPDGEGTISFTHYNEYSNLLRVEVAVEWGGHPRTLSTVLVRTLLTNK